MSLLNLMSGRVGGEAVLIREEYATITGTVTLQQPQINKPPAILSDCMSAITVLMLWCGCDFRYDPEEEKHWDIVSDILSNIRK